MKAFEKELAMAEILELRAENDALKTMLKKHEWSASDEWDDMCPECGAYKNAKTKQTHRPNCELAELLK